MKRFLFIISSLFMSITCRSAVTSILTPPAGNNGEVQFNSKNSFGADSDMTFSTTTNCLTVSSAAVTYAAISTTSVRQLRFPDGTTQTSAAITTGDMILASTQTSTGAKTFNSYSVFSGSVSAVNGAFSTGLGIGTTTVSGTYSLNLRGFGIARDRLYFGDDQSFYIEPSEGGDTMGFDFQGVQTSTQT